MLSTKRLGSLILRQSTVSTGPATFFVISSFPDRDRASQD